jgi:hypothetical protein
MPQRKPLKIPRKAADVIAREVINAGHFPVPLEPRSKKPVEDGWTASRITSDDVPARFPPDCNVGILTGVTGLVDLDLDCDEAIALADDYLPETGWVWGRKGAPRSHRLYRVPGDPPITRTMADPTKSDERGMLVEFRSTGHQTLYPGSTHPSGELVRWVTHEQPAEVESHALLRCARQLAAACLLARNWDPGSRDEIAASLIGMLDGRGWTAADIRAFLEPILRSVGDEESRDRLNKIERTPRARAEGAHIFGLPKLVEKLGQEVVSKLVEWLELDARPGSNAARLPLGLRSAFDIVNTPVKASWLLRPYLEEYAIAVLTGDYGTFKSFLALDWALHLATGKRWHNDPRGSE